jgi:hypothetical protein
MFLRFPVYFVEEDDASYEMKENLKLKPDQTEGEIVINTNCICAYNENSETLNTMCRMSNGDVMELPIDIDAFEDILGQTEGIIKLAEIGNN